MSSGSQYLVVTVVAAEVLDTLPSGNFVVEVSVDKAISKSTVKTGKVEAGEGDLKFETTDELKCSKVEGDLVATVKLMKAGTMKNTEFASGTMELGQLAGGSLKVEESVTVSTEEGVEAARVDIAVEWKEGYGPNQTLAKADEKGEGDGEEEDKEAKEKEAAKKKKKLTPLPNCEFQDYTVRVRVHKARNLQAMKEGKEYDPFVKAEVGNESQETSFVKKTSNPTFDDELVFSFTKVEKDFWNKPITISVYDHRIIGSSVRIGAAQLDCAAVYRENSEHFMAHRWLALLKGITEGNVMGFLKCSIAVLHTRDDPVPDDLPDPNEGDEEAIVNNLVAGPGAMFENIFLEFDVHRAQHLPKMGSRLVNGRTDAYVKFAYGTKKVRTPVEENSCDPEWGTSVTLPITFPPLTGLVVMSLFDKKTIGSDRVIARHRFDVNKMRPDDDPETLPRLLPAFVNVYGLPRGMEPGLNDWYQRMSNGEVSGVEYRGRLLTGMEAFREKVAKESQPVLTFKVDVVVLVQVLMVNMIPGGKYFLRLTIGENETVTQPKRASRMHGATKMQYLYFNEELMVHGSFEVTKPPEEKAKTPEAWVTRQLPDAILTLVEVPIVKGPLYSPTEPYAYKRWKLEDLVRAGKGVTACECIDLNRDTSEVSQGNPPIAPMMQLVAGAYLSKAAEELMIKPRQAVPMPGLSTGDTKKYLLEVCIYHAENIPAADSNGLSDPFIRISFGNGTAQTGHKLSSLNPTYNEMLRVDADLKPRQQFPDIVIEIWDWDRIGSDTFLCRKVVDFKYAERAEFAGKYRWVEDFTDNMGLPVNTRVVMSFEAILGTPAARKNVPKMIEHRRDPRKPNDTYSGYPIPDNKKMPMAPFEVSVKLHALRSMKKFRLRQIQAPSVSMQFMEQAIEFGKRDGPNPTYNLETTVKMLLPKEEHFLPRMQILVYDNRMGSRVLVGAANDTLTDWKYHPRKREEKRREQDEQLRKRVDKMCERKFAKPRSPEALRKLAKKEKRHRKRAEAVAKAMALLAVKKQKHEEEMRQQALREEAEKRGTVPVAGANASGSPDVPIVRVQRQALGTDDGGDETAVPLLATNDNGEAAKANGMGGDDGGDDGNNSDQGGNDGASTTAGETSATDASDMDDGEEPKWFEKYDAAEAVHMMKDGPPDGGRVNGRVRFDDIVTRLTLMRGKAYLEKRVEPTAENYFGPFDDLITCEVRRGAGDDSIVAGFVRYDAMIQRLPDAEYDEAKKSIGKRFQIDRGSNAASAFADDTDAEGDGEDQQYMARVYLISCSSLTPQSIGPLGGSADPYVKLELMADGMDKDERIRVKCDDENSIRYSTLNPEYFMVRELTGTFPKHSTLRVTMMDHGTLSDTNIGFADIDLETRWMGRRAYHRFKDTEDKYSLERGKAYENMLPGSYVEKIQLKDKTGARAGTVEVWVDLFVSPTPAPPPPIDISPPPPDEVEVRATVWATRDIELVDTGPVEDTVDVYVRAYMDGMRHDIQKTDVNYRSTDGSATFDWLMTYPLMFDARKNKVFPVQKAETFTIFKKEPKLLDPTFVIEVMNNNTFFSDDYIGNASINLLDVRQALTSRDVEAFVRKEPRCCWYCNYWPWSRICYKRNVLAKTLADRQKVAAKEFATEMEARQLRTDGLVDERMKAIYDAPEGMFSERVQRKLRKKFEREVNEELKVNVFDTLGPKRKKKVVSKPNPDDEDPEKKPDPRIVETPKFWIACRGPKGNNRVGDVQVSFGLVKVSEIKRDANLAAAKGRSNTDLDRPDQPSFLKNPTKAAYQMMWQQYRLYIITGLCILLSAIYLILLTKRTLDTEIDTYF